MDDPGDDWGDTVGGFDVGGLTVAQRQDLSTDLTAAGVLHAFVGVELQGPASESELIEHLIEQTRRRGGRGGRRARMEARVVDPTEDTPAGDGPAGAGPSGLGGFGGGSRAWGVIPSEVAGLTIAPRWRRFVAYLAEAVAFSLVAAILFRYSAGGAQIFSLIIGLTSSVVLVAMLGATVGMIVLRMRVVLVADPSRPAPGWRVAIVRYLVAWWPPTLMVALTPFVAVEDLGWLNVIAEIWLIVCFGPILIDPARRGLHDRVAGTVVVDAPR